MRLRSTLTRFPTNSLYEFSGIKCDFAMKGFTPGHCGVPGQPMNRTSLRVQSGTRKSSSGIVRHRVRERTKKRDPIHRLRRNVIHEFGSYASLPRFAWRITNAALQLILTIGYYFKASLKMLYYGFDKKYVISKASWSTAPCMTDFVKTVQEFAHVTKNLH